MLLSLLMLFCHCCTAVQTHCPLLTAFSTFSLHMIIVYYRSFSFSHQFHVFFHASIKYFWPFLELRSSPGLSRLHYIVRTLQGRPNTALSAPPAFEKEEKRKFWTDSNIIKRKRIKTYIIYHYSILNHTKQLTA